MSTCIVGGGAAGYFLAINLKEMQPDMDVTILERSHRLLAKVEVSGGGRCNCTNTFANVTDLRQVYPRGHRLLKRLFKAFGPRDAYRWFESHGVPLTVQPDGCIFPSAQDSHAIIHLFQSEAARLGVKVKVSSPVRSLADLSAYDNKAIAIGGSSGQQHLEWLHREGFAMEPPVPSLFSFRIEDASLHALMGLVVEPVAVSLAGTKHRASGPLLITHWGMSGPAILKLSSHAARHLAQQGYHGQLLVNWVHRTEQDVLTELQATIAQHRSRQLAGVRPFGLPSRLWSHLLAKCMPAGEQTRRRWGDLGRKDVNRLAVQLCQDVYPLAGRAPFKDEFVTCGGIALSEVHPHTLESRTHPGVYFAGEVLDIDGITGGFNFQAAWTTAHTVACAIRERSQSRS